MNQDLQKRYAGIEAGGTKFVCAIGFGNGEITEQKSFPTTSPEETLERAIKFIEVQKRSSPVSAIGIASFGPIDVNPGSPKYGHITSTPKPGWSDTDFVGFVQASLGLPVGFDTDVNGAAQGEHLWGAGQGLDTFIYLTVGTGIGGGGLVNGKRIHGLVHPEMGHIPVMHDRMEDPFEGICPYHGDCLEGLANGPAMEERWGMPPEQIPRDHPAWDLEALYLARALASYIFVLSPQRLILGGGVMNQVHLFPKIRQRVSHLLAGYIQSEQILSDIENYIVPPALGSKSGVLGAIALAIEAARPDG